MSIKSGLPLLADLAKSEFHNTDYYANRAPSPLCVQPWQSLDTSIDLSPQSYSPEFQELLNTYTPNTNFDL